MPQAPFVDPTTGDIALVWRMFLTQLWTRTGSALGGDINNPTLAAQLALETQQRQTADTALTAAIGTETARAEGAESDLRAGLATEAAIRASGDGHSAQLVQDARADLNASVAAETAARIAADALLVPIASLCAMWAACNLHFLPAADPGHGQPWQSNGYLVIGAVTPIAPAVSNFVLEDASGDWTLENGVDRWLWG
jgi:hypothetical protein